jgi:glycerol dehydrogenase-like iron-containing ADH family enzyme
MANAHDSTSMEISPAAAAIIASTAKEVAEQQAMNEALEAQIQDGVQELLRVSGTVLSASTNRACSIASVPFSQHPLTSS